MNRPKLACCNFIPEITLLKEFALQHGFQGVDWSFTPENLPRSPAQESSLVKAIASLYPLEVRYHCAFRNTDIGDVDKVRAKEAVKIFKDVCRLVSKLGGRFLTIHVGLGRDSTIDLSWQRTIEGLANVVRFANEVGVRLCLENLAWGWTSRPELFEKLVRKSGSWATLDIGHAQVSPSIRSQHYQLVDFVSPHPERFLSAHVYHEEKGTRHLSAGSVKELENRLHLLRKLPLCDWWVLELRQEEPLLSTLKMVREFFDSESAQPPTFSPQ